MIKCQVGCFWIHEFGTKWKYIIFSSFYTNSVLISNTEEELPEAGESVSSITSLVAPLVSAIIQYQPQPIYLGLVWSIREAPVEYCPDLYGSEESGWPLCVVDHHRFLSLVPVLPLKSSQNSPGCCITEGTEAHIHCKSVVVVTKIFLSSSSWFLPFACLYIHWSTVYRAGRESTVRCTIRL